MYVYIYFYVSLYLFMYLFIISLVHVLVTEAFQINNNFLKL